VLFWTNGVRACMNNIALRTEYSFSKAFAHIEEIVKLDGNAICIADEDSTFGHYQLFKLCSDSKKKPMLGVRIQVIDFKVEKEKKWGIYYIFIAKNNNGLKEIYRLVKKSYANFYYMPFIESSDVNRISNDVFVVAEYWHKNNVDRINYAGLSHTTPVWNRSGHGKKSLAIQSNRYIRPEDKLVYQLFAGDKAENSVNPQHVLSSEEHLAFFGDKQAIENTYEIAEQCDVSFVKSDMVKYKGRLDITLACKDGARRKGIDLNQKEYKERFEREMDLIAQKSYSDYFLIVASMIRDAKRTMLVGPSRGSSAGSLVCYLLDITEVDPIKYDLLFERFIDINRLDLPDIDVDFPDIKRHKVIDQLTRTYGENYVTHIATVSRLKPKSAIGIFAQNLCIPKSETGPVKDAIVERSGGDARASMCIADTFTSSEIARQFIENYPAMRLTERIEGHASHTGTHAAGILVCNDDLTNYGSVNVRENVIMLDKEEAEGLNLLKIDCLGLRTLSILEEVAERINMPYSGYYKLRLDDEKVFAIFNDMRLFGIFQFEGYALQAATRSMGVHCFDDICAITSLARPGPIHSGGTNMFILRRTGQEPVRYMSSHPSVVNATKDTLGIIIYQEQLMQIAREYGKMSWEDVSQLRKAASKSLGEEFFNRYKNKFLEGTRSQGIDDLEADYVWRNMMTFGSWGFNKSHAVGYGIISYWTAWAKAYHPLEFAAATMNNTKGDESAIRILRDMVKNDGIQYTAIDPDESTERWEIADGKLVGALTNIHGIGIKKAKDIVQRRKTGDLTKNQIMKLLNAETPFDVIFPAEHHWGDIYKNWQKYGFDRPIDLIENVKEIGEYVCIGKLVNKNLRDLNEYQSLVKRGGQVVEHDSLFLHLAIEDDTDSLLCTIDRYRFEQIGRKISEQGKEDYDWYLVAGYVKDQWRRLYIREAINLWEWKAKLNANC
jgi:DNA polymerase III alpha subunit